MFNNDCENEPLTEGAHFAAPCTHADYHYRIVIHVLKHEKNIGVHKVFRISFWFHFKMNYGFWLSLITQN